MQTVSVRRLSASDSDVVADFLARTSKSDAVFKVAGSIDRRDYILRNLQSAEAGNELRTILYGFFRDQTMTGLTRASIWKQLPYYTLDNQLLENPENSPIYYSKFINQMMTVVLREMEAVNRFTFYVATLLRPGHLRQLSIEHVGYTTGEYIEEFARYDCQLEELIPANRASEFPVYRSLLGNKIWPVAVAIKRYSLKNEFRKEKWRPVVDSMLVSLPGGC